MIERSNDEESLLYTAENRQQFHTFMVRFVNSPATVVMIFWNVNGFYMFLSSMQHIFCANPGGSHSCFQVGSSEAASAALPALTMLAEDAEAKYGDNRKWPGQPSGGAE